MKFDRRRLLPAGLTGEAGLPFWTFVLVTVVGTVRSLIHMLAPDGGAGSIAGIATSGVGGSNLVALFGQWGASQLVLALIYWAVILRYRALVPLMWLTVLAEQVLRFAEGHLKPVISSHVPPGAYGTDILMGLSVVMLLGSLARA